MSIATVHHDAIISVTLHADGTSTIEATIAGYDDGPTIHDHEGAVVEPGTDLHSALWNTAALVRMPGGVRDNGARQYVCYFRPQGEK